jgi:hypothetical protein
VRSNAATRHDDASPRQLDEILLEIEWASRRRPTRGEMRRINELAREALQLTHGPALAQAPGLRSVGD